MNAEHIYFLFSNDEGYPMLVINARLHINARTMSAQQK